MRGTSIMILGLTLRKNLRYLFVLPVVVAISFLIAYPLVYEVWISFFLRTILGRPLKFIWLANYVRVLSSPAFYAALGKSFYYVGLTVGLRLLVGLGIALCLNTRFKGHSIIKAIAFLPWTIPVFVIALVWRWVLDYNGLVNMVLRVFGVNKILWFGPELAFFSLVLVTVWRGFPFFMIGILAGLQSIPPQLYEAAAIDGAAGHQSFFTITLPLLKPVMSIITLLSVIWSFGSFVLIWLLTSGGPGTKTTVLPITIYKEAFFSNRIPKAAAMSILIVPIFLVLIFVVIKLMGESKS